MVKLFVKLFFCVFFIFLNSFSILGTISTQSVSIPPNYKLYYDLTDPSFTLRLATSISLALPNKKSYTIGSSSSWLNNNVKKCILSNSNGLITANFNSTLINTYIFSNNIADNILDANLWMNTSVSYFLNYPDGTYTGISNIQTFLVKDVGTNLPINNINIVDIQNLVNAGNYQPGTYSVVGKVTPIDLKCNFISNNILEATERNNLIVPTKTFNVFNDTDNDGWDDGVLVNGIKTYILPNKKDLCPGVGVSTTTQATLDKFQGCATEYTSLSCSGSMSFDGEKINLPFHLRSKLIYTSDDNQIVEKKLKSKLFGKIKYEPKEKSGTYYGKYYKVENILPLETSWKDDGSCHLRYNALSSCEIGDEKLTQGSTKDFYKYSNILPSERSDKKSNTCTGANSFLDIISVNSGYKISKPIFLGKRYKNVKRDDDGNFTLIGNRKRSKISCPDNSLNCRINIGGVKVKINLSDLNISSHKSFKIYKQGILDRVEKIDAKVIALNAHRFKKFRTVNQAVNFVNKSVNLMEKFDIVKDLNYNSVSNITNVKISTSNFTDAGKIQNLTIYQVIDKSVAQSYDDINFISDGGGQRFVIDKDPIIGWYFNDTSGSTTIEYNVSGNNEGGTIIITQEPILFNEGELIINYREGKVGCNAGEVHLFDLQGLDNSVIVSKNSGVYQVCITHLDSNINLLSGNLGSNIVNISSYNLGSNISSNFDLLTNKLQLSVNNNGIYWDLRVQRDNPDGNFSCLGSYDKLGQSSLFGDCGFKPQNRIWMHLGADYLPPKTTVSIPHLAHTVSVSLNAVDNIGGSKVNSTFYCAIDNSNSCQNLNTDFTTYLNPFQLNCPSDWSCSKILKYYSTDYAGNVENITTTELYLIDKGSACQSDCTAKPSPNRYLKECRNLNGCFYKPTPFELGLDKGRTVANSCNLLVKGSYVLYNQTHEIKCPSGPFKLKKFTSTNLDLTSSSCEFLIKNQFPIIYDGEQIIMDIFSCTNKN